MKHIKESLQEYLVDNNICIIDKNNETHIITASFLSNHEIDVYTIHNGITETVYIKTI